MVCKDCAGNKCPECNGIGEYFTEWSDSAEQSENLRSMVLFYPDPPDGTVLIRCCVCEGSKRIESNHQACINRNIDKTPADCDCQHKEV